MRPPPQFYTTVIHSPLSKVIEISSILNNYFKPLEADQPKFHVEPPWKEEAKNCSNGPGHMTKMTAISIHGKKLFFFGTLCPMSVKPGIQHRTLVYYMYQVCSNDYPRLTFDLFTQRSLWFLMHLYEERLK